MRDPYFIYCITNTSKRFNFPHVPLSSVHNIIYQGLYRCCELSLPPVDSFMFGPDLSRSLIYNIVPATRRVRFVVRSEAIPNCEYAAILIKNTKFFYFNISSPHMF